MARLRGSFSSYRVGPDGEILDGVTLCSPMRGEAPTSSSGRRHEVGGSSEEEGARPAKKPRQEGREPFEPKDMPQDMRHYIEATLEGTDISPVSQKTLMATDVNSHHRRVFLPKADIAFLSEEEKAKLESPTTKDRPTPVQVVDPHQLEFRRPDLLRLAFTRWELKKKKNRKASTVYVLTTGGWAKLVDDNKLAVDDEIQIWSFRVRYQLHMAVVVAKRAAPQR